MVTPTCWRQDWSITAKGLKIISQARPTTPFHNNWFIKLGQYRPRTLGNLTAEQLTVAPGHVVVNDLQTLKETKFPELSWKVDDKKGSAELMEDVIEGKLDYTIADSVAISLFQRVHPELAVALDITDEQPVTWFSPLDGDNTLSAALLDFFNEMNEDGTLARIEEKYLGMAMILITSIRAHFYAPSMRYCRS